jgi:hypothetical protein
MECGGQALAARRLGQVHGEPAAFGQLAPGVAVAVRGADAACIQPAAFGIGVAVEGGEQPVGQPLRLGQDGGGGVGVDPLGAGGVAQERQGRVDLGKRAHLEPQV